MLTSYYFPQCSSQLQFAITRCRCCWCCCCWLLNTLLLGLYLKSAPKN